MFNFTCHIERWKYNKEYNIFVSSEGRLRDKEKKEIFPKISHNYLFYYNMTDTTIKRIPVHRLVMITFKPINNYKEMTVDHLNHNTRDNRLINLEWVTDEENQYRSKRDHDIEADRDFSKGILLGSHRDENDERFLINNVIFNKEDAVKMLSGGAPNSSMSKDRVEMKLNQIFLNKQQRKYKISGFIIERCDKQEYENSNLQIKINGFIFNFLEAIDFIYSHNSFTGSKENLKKNLLNFLKKSKKAETIMYNFCIEKC